MQKYKTNNQAISQFLEQNTKNKSFWIKSMLKHTAAPQQQLLNFGPEPNESSNDSDNAHQIYGIISGSERTMLNVYLCTNL